MDLYRPLIQFIDNFSGSSAEYWTPYIAGQLKKNETLDLLHRISNESGKTPGETILVFLSALRYLINEPGTNAYVLMEQENSFQKYLSMYSNDIYQLSIEKKVQANIPERGLPILDILNKKLRNSSIGLIELGSSFGLIGYSLCKPVEVIWNKELYFRPEQKIPAKQKNIEYYLGIDVDPPSREWLYACTPRDDYTHRIKSMIDTIQMEENFQVIKASAFGFSRLHIVNELLFKPYTWVVLTSFLLYQFSKEQKNKLTEEILGFIHLNHGHWINQTVETDKNHQGNKYFIEFDGSKIIELMDDRCHYWEWI
jgi:hypothetical protein